MVKRPDGFLSEENIDHDSEIFKYIRELNDYLWRFVRHYEPGAQGNLADYLDFVLDGLEHMDRSTVDYIVSETDHKAIDSLLRQAQTPVVPYNPDLLIMANQAISEMQTRIKAARDILRR